MTAYPAWTPAPRPGIVPLQPLSFGTILGRSFTALRHNPRVLLGFALVVQSVVYLVVTVVVTAVAYGSFSRLDSIAVGTDEWDAVLTGSVVLTSVLGLALSLAAGAISVIVQAVVITDVLHAVVAEKMPLPVLWRRIRPVAWRLVGYTVLVALALGIIFALAGGLLVLAGTASPVAAVPVAFGLILAAIPLGLWLSVKLLLIPAVIIVEGATIRAAIVRSWRLSRGRFWAILGITILISMVFGAVAQIVSIPFGVLAGAMSVIVTPTGDPEPAALVTLVVTFGLGQMVTLLVQSVGLIVQSTATGLIYVDVRMRHEALDADLLAYVDAREAGATDLPDPYVSHLAQPRWAPPTTPPVATPTTSALPREDGGAPEEPEGTWVSPR